MTPRNQSSTPGPQMPQPALPSSVAGTLINPSVGVGLQGVSDATTQYPFLDVFKTARQWEGHVPGQYGGIPLAALEAAGLLDADGWPLSLPASVMVNGQSLPLSHIGTVLLTELPAAMTSAAGRYRLTYDGDGEIRVNGASNVTYGDGEIWFDYEPDGARLVFVDIMATTEGNHVRNMHMVHEAHIARFDAGEVFNPAWIEVIQDMRSLRFMDWMQTNNSDQGDWTQRPQISHYTWGDGEGVPLEVMIDLANLTGTDPWFTLPHLATPAYIEAFATLVRDRLDPDLKAYFEYSNEVWNWQFEQAQWAHAQGQARWPGTGDAWIQWQAMKAVEMSTILDRVFGAEADSRLVRVISTQTGWRGLENPLLEAPDWVAEDPATHLPPALFFDAYGVTGYFDGALGRDEKVAITRDWLAQSLVMAEEAATALGLGAADHAAYVAAHRFDHATALAIQEMRDGSVTGNPAGSLAEVIESFAYHAAVAAAHGLQLVMYEGGTHLVGVGANAHDAALTEFFLHVNQSAEIGPLYTELMAGWRAAGGTLFNAFVDVGAPGWWGSWGNMQHIDDRDSPRWEAITRFNTANPGWWEDRSATAFSDAGGTDHRQTGTSGNDRLSGGDGSDTLNGGAGDDFLFGGSSAADLRDVIFGGDGQDYIDGGAGNDELHGGAGDDTINGSLGADTLIGNEDRDVLSGGGGSDLIFGNAEDDFINGGFGYDRLNGGAGADVFFHLGIADHGSDWIQDYTAAEGDVLRIGIAGAQISDFQINHAHTANAGSADVAEAFIIYRPTGQILFALVDGGAQNQIHISLGGQVFDLMG